MDGSARRRLTVGAVAFLIEAALFGATPPQSAIADSCTDPNPNWAACQMPSGSPYPLTPQEQALIDAYRAGFAAGQGAAGTSQPPP
jgi:hypothetical protein